MSKVGSRLPTHATGLGKVSLAYVDQEELDEWLDGVTLERFTENMVVDSAELRGALARIVLTRRLL
ncbi:IclR family transcriptional regulator domain-containing protein [Phytoactinopolyspora limicola]|uniref:IclR family transcriptional regulator domain-containing protein n=1 Tax=Phytoactinopolyspora limicola TaxID=2715536 RepID=UPI00140BAF22|nr:IclR family transcriptional regulator C-terminal domain-containing protein [Phytoactinopolyspora limicola]